MLLPVSVGVSEARRVTLLAQNLVPPSPVSGTFLVDTGASGTCMDSSLIGALGIPPSGCVDVQTPTTDGVPLTRDQYDVSIYVPNVKRLDPANWSPGFVINALPVLGTSLKSQGIDGLIGRDILSMCVLIYNPMAGIFTLSY
jgi:hypothetical protein